VPTLQFRLVSHPLSKKYVNSYGDIWWDLFTQVSLFCPCFFSNLTLENPQSCSCISLYTSCFGKAQRGLVQIQKQTET
jgi:hypothetical protein